MRKTKINNNDISSAMTLHLGQLFKKLPDKPEFVPGIRRAPKRASALSEQDIRLALRNALRYIPDLWHEQLAPDFMVELLANGRIYG